MATLSLAQLKSYAMQAGFSAQQASTMAAIAMAESGGRTTAYNGVGRDNSYGLWQINMIGAMGPQRRAQFGISNNQQLFDPLTNARAAYAVFKSQGFKAWSVYSHGTYNKFLPAALRTETGNYQAGGAIPALLPNLNWRDVAAQFGIAAAFFNLDPSLKELVERAAKEGWDATRFQGALQDTPWYQRLSASQREWHTLWAVDRTTVNQRLTQRAEDINSMARSMGVSVDPWKYTNMSLEFGWDQAAIRRAIAGEWRLDMRNLSGEAGSAVQALAGAYHQYAMPVSWGSIEYWTRNLLAGGGNIEGFQAAIQQAAKNAYPQIAPAIEQGQTVVQIMNPYTEMAAREVNATNVDYSEAKWNRAIGSAQAGLMPLADWQSTLRKDPTYGYDTTPQARQKAAQFAATIAERFGGI